MENNMETIEMEGCPLNMDAEWCPLVNERADKAEQTRQKKVSWAEQQKANHRAEKRIRRLMSALAWALALIIAGSVCLNYVDSFPIWISASVSVGGMAVLSFLLGWIFGHRARR